MTLESKENYPRHTKIVQNSLGFMLEVKPLHKARGDLVLCALLFDIEAARNPKNNVLHQISPRLKT